MAIEHAGEKCIQFVLAGAQLHLDAQRPKGPAADEVGADLHEVFLGRHEPGVGRLRLGPVGEVVDVVARVAVMIGKALRARYVQTGVTQRREELVVVRETGERWDHASVHEFRGTYGEYLLNKVSKVFPELKNNVL